MQSGKQTLLSKESLAKLHDPGSGQYAGGWIVMFGKRGKTLLHSGSNTMWYATAFVIPDEHAAFVIATNKFDMSLELSLAEIAKRYQPRGSDR
jgi:hypothetical protein